MRFEYQIRDHHGRLQRGQVEATHKDALVTGLLDQQYFIISLRELGWMNKSYYWAGKISSFNQVRSRDLVVFTRQMAAMLGAGLPILRSLEVLSQQTNPARLKEAVLVMQTDIEAGLAFWEAVARHPQIFSGIYISMLKAGEVGGVLEVVLERLSSYLEREQEIKAKVKAVSLYPATISILALLMVFFIITWVLPNFSAIFESAGVQLPVPTRLLLGAGAWFKIRGLGLLIGIAIISYAVKGWGKNPQGRIIRDNFYLHLPVVGGTISKVAVARFTRTLAILIKSGIPVLTALEVTQDSIDNAIIRRAILQACTRIKEGETIAAPFKEARLFEPMVTHMIAVGEETGRLEEMLSHLSAYYERELMHAVDYLTAAIEPVLILMVAILIGSIVIATLLPIFDMMNLVGI